MDGSAIIKESKVSRSKTEYMECRYSNPRKEDMEQLKSTQRSTQKMSCPLPRIYFIRDDIEDEIRNRISVGWLKERSASGVLCDRRIPISYRKICR